MEPTVVRWQRQSRKPLEKSSTVKALISIDEPCSDIEGIMGTHQVLIFLFIFEGNKNKIIYSISFICSGYVLHNAALNALTMYGMMLLVAHGQPGGRNVALS